MMDILSEASALGLPVPGDKGLSEREQACADALVAFLAEDDAAFDEAMARFDAAEVTHG